MRAKLTEPEREDWLPVLLSNGWHVMEERDAIAKTYTFRNFIEAFQWMTGVAIWAEKWDHHPEWSNVYRTVNVVLTTHDAGGLTELDVTLARKMDTLAPDTAG